MLSGTPRCRYVYALHGFKVTSIEMLPINFVKSALADLAPGILQVTGDGSKLVPEHVASAPPGERIAIIFDGEKRRAASLRRNLRGLGRCFFIEHARPLRARRARRWPIS